MRPMNRATHRRRTASVMLVRAALAAALCVVLPRVATAQLIQQLLGKKTAATDTGKQVSVTAPDSPRASLSAFLAYAQAGDYTRAAQYLDVPEAERAQSKQLADRKSTRLNSSHPSNSYAVFC